MNRIFLRLRSFFQWNKTEKTLFLEAVFYLFAAKMLLLLFPFKYCMRFLKCGNCIHKDWSPEYLQSIKTSIYRANKLAFWNNECLVQSFAARWMLNRRNIPSKLYIGVAHNESKKIIAHAWIIAKSMEIVNKGTDYEELFSC